MLSSYLWNDYEMQLQVLMAFNKNAIKCISSKCLTDENQDILKHH